MVNCHVKVKENVAHCFQIISATLFPPKWVLMLMYRAVPLKLFFSSIWNVLEASWSMYALAIPKSTMYIKLSAPIKKLSGLMSL